MNKYLTILFLSLFAISVPTMAYAHCGACGTAEPHDHKKICEKKCKDAKDKDACMKKCEKDHAKQGKKKKKKKK